MLSLCAIELWMSRICVVLSFLCDVLYVLMCLWYGLCVLFVYRFHRLVLCALFCKHLACCLLFGVYLLFVVCCVVVCCFIGLSCVYVLLLPCFRFLFFLLVFE